MPTTLPGLAIIRPFQKGLVRTKTGSAIFSLEDTDTLSDDTNTAPSGVLYITDGLSDFSRFFAPLKPLFPNRLWVLQSAEDFVLAFPDDWYVEYDPSTDKYTSPRLQAVERLILEETDKTRDWKYVDGQYLAEVADTLIDGWCYFLRLRAPIASLDAFITDFWRASKKRVLHEWLTERVDLCLIGIDGMRWDVYAEDEQILQTVRDHLKTVPDIEVRDSTLAEGLF